MAFSQEDQFHGAALIQIVDHPSFTALNAGNERGLYRINDHAALYAKYSQRPGNGRWQFTFDSRHQEICRDQFNAYDVVDRGKFWIALICVNDWVCLIDYPMYEQLLGPNYRDSRRMVVERQPDGSYWVSGPNGQWPNAVPKNAFPGVIFRV